MEYAPSRPVICTFTSCKAPDVIDTFLLAGARFIIPDTSIDSACTKRAKLSILFISIEPLSAIE